MSTIQLDISFLFQIILFVLLWAGLKRLLFDPVVRVLDTREARTSGLSREAAALKAAADHGAAEYERRMQQARQELAAEIETLRIASEREERQVIAEAHHQASTRLLQLRETLAREAESARVPLGAEARALSLSMLERVVGRKIA